MEFKIKNLNLLVIALVIWACGNQTKNEYSKIDYSEAYHKAQQDLSDAMVHDIFAPPLASRTYAYASLASYYACQLNSADSIALFDRLNGFEKLATQVDPADYSMELSSILAFYNTAEKLVFTPDSLQKAKEELLEKVKMAGVDEEILKNSRKLAKTISQHILDWSKKDGYTTIRMNDGYLLSEQKGKWRPTPPVYMEPILPSWNKLRPFILDSATQFKPPPPPPFNMADTSRFYRDLIQVYETSNQLSDEQKEIAGFWDCNPFVVEEKGHLMIGLKKISPGGHWMGITQLILKEQNADLKEASRTYSLVALTLADAFISCWDEKYRSNYIRPVTIINQEIDPSWKPALQTPPFPEYTSGHSVISTAASVMLTKLYGDNYAFTDSVEVSYGLGARSFESFRKAADEAAISRLYGGIHYMPAIEMGVKQGELIGDFIIEEVFK